MAYQAPNTQVQATTTTVNAPSMSRWWPIGFLLASIAFFIIGGALFGTWGSNTYCYYDDIDGYLCDGRTSGLFYGGVACCVIAGILKLIFWITLFVWCAWRRRSSTTTVVQVNTAPVVTENKPSTNVSAQQTQIDPSAPQSTYYYPQSAPTPAPTYTSVQSQGGMNVPELGNQPTKYCGNCGTTATSPFCMKCGAQIWYSKLICSGMQYSSSSWMIEILLVGVSAYNSSIPYYLAN